MKKTKSLADGGNLGGEYGADCGVPEPMRINTADIWMKAQKSSEPDRKGLDFGQATIESAAEEDTLLGRLAKRMASRDYIDNLDLGTRTAKQVKSARETSEDSKTAKEISENVTSSPKGAGLHFQMLDKKVVNFSDPIPTKMVMEGNNMAQQAANAGKVIGENRNLIGKPYSQ